MTAAMTTLGRPPAFSDDERQKRILDAAEEVFDQKGYGDATMEEIAQAAGMAKKTLYKYFPDKPAVFCTLINTHDDVLMAKASEAMPDDLRGQLRKLLHDLASFVLAPRQLRLTRLIIAESRKHPELAERFHSECMERALTMFLGQFDKASAALPQDETEARMIADTFLGAALGPLQFRALIMPIDHEVIVATLDERIELVTDQMLNYLNGRARTSVTPASLPTSDNSSEQPS